MAVAANARGGEALPLLLCVRPAAHRRRRRAAASISSQPPCPNRPAMPMRRPPSSTLAYAALHCRRSASSSRSSARGAAMTGFVSRATQPRPADRQAVARLYGADRRRRHRARSRHAVGRRDAGSAGNDRFRQCACQPDDVAARRLHRLVGGLRRALLGALDRLRLRVGRDGACSARFRVQRTVLVGLLLVSLAAGWWVVRVAAQAAARGGWNGSTTCAPSWRPPRGWRHGRRSARRCFRSGRSCSSPLQLKAI